MCVFLFVNVHYVRMCIHEYMHCVPVNVYFNKSVCVCVCVHVCVCVCVCAQHVFLSTVFVNLNDVSVYFIHSYIP